MESNLFVYDDTVETSAAIKNIIAKQSFGNIILKRKKLKNLYFNYAKDSNAISEIHQLSKKEDFFALNKKLIAANETMHIVHVFSNFVVSDEKKFSIILDKVPYVKENIEVCNAGNPAALIFKNKQEYAKFLKIYIDDLNITKSLKCVVFEKMETDISNRKSFLLYISSGFDARFFNSLVGDEYTVTKSSDKINKIKNEYTFYYLLPDDMKMWFVRPYNYEESANVAKYTMERYNIADLAIRWIHGAVSKEEFGDLLEKVFYFIKTRASKNESPNIYERIEGNLYIKKVEERIAELKRTAHYDLFNTYIANGTKYKNFSNLIVEYKNLYEQVKNMGSNPYISVIGHGDLCFSNMLYSRENNILRLIDPKGALVEEDLWTNPYYDIAKLSHSICGRYDFFNNGLYDISLKKDFQFELKIEFDNSEYINMFKVAIEKHGFSYLRVRLYEASLFLSMLPLHIDNPHKVFGFLLNAINILDEVKKCLVK
jgi:thiamine kinase-like enzyme